MDSVGIDRQELLKHVELDKRRAVELHQAAEAEMRKPTILIAGDITGSPKVASEFSSFKHQQRGALRAIIGDPFFARVDLLYSMWGKKDVPCAFLITKSRTLASLEGDGWEVVSWTAPITASLLDQPIGEEISFQVRKRSSVHYKILTSAKFSTILPSISDARYLLHSGEFSFEAESQLHLEELVLAKEVDRRPYEAQATFGLNEIIVLADQTQRTAMHLPFKESVVIEGPPGSGKTSIGIMRIPCLLDRQWKELNIESSSVPYHSPQSMRVLVLNDEMVDYLDSLTRSLGIQGVQVMTMLDFMRQICRDARTLSGRKTREHAPGARLKAHPGALGAYWAGFVAHVSRVLDDESELLCRKFAEAGPAGLAVWTELSRWAIGLRSARVDNRPLPDFVNLAARADAWIERSVASMDSGNSQQFEGDAERQKKRAELRDLLRSASERLLQRRAIVQEMFATDEYRTLLLDFARDAKAPGVAADADAQWRSQYESEQPTYSEYDAALAAWLGVHVALVPARSTKSSPPFVGRRADRLTHVLIDEAQDVWPAHTFTIQRLLVENGTLTLVGDLRQRLKDVDGMHHWKDLGINNLKTAVFEVNYRQSGELGRFVHSAHGRLYGEAPKWTASDGRSGPLPRVVRASSRHLTEAAGAEVKRWREEIPRATIGVLYDGRWSANA